MIKDEELNRISDYSEGQKEAAHRILIEITNLLTPFSEDMRIIGGWACNWR